MTSKEYRLIEDRNNIDEVFTHHHDEDLGFSKRHQFFNGIMSITLALSLAANALFITLYFLHRPQGISSNSTAFGRVALERCII